MLAIKAKYKNGKITLLNALPKAIKKAHLTIVVEPEEEQDKIAIPAQEFPENAIDSESEFKRIGLNSFFDNENDTNIDWEDYFGLK